MWLGDSLIAFLLAFCFAATGDLVLGRDSKRLLDWSQSFVVGLSVASVLLFPLTLAAPDNALNGILVLIATCGLLSLGRRSRATEVSWGDLNHRSLRLRWRTDPISLLLTMALVGQSVSFAVQNFRWSYAWDGFQIWATKALVLYHRGGLTADLLVPGERERVAAYPTMVPLYEALVFLVRGEFAWNSAKPVFAVFFICLLLSTYRAAICVVPKRLALLCTALVAILPAVSSRESVGGYADMPQACLVAALAAALLSSAMNKEGSGGWRHPAAWLCCGVALVKSEGSVLLAVVCLTVLLGWAIQGRRQLAARFWRYRYAMAVVAMGAATRWLSLQWTDALDLTYGPINYANVLRASDRLATLPSQLLNETVQFAEWGYFWPGFLVSTGLVMVLGKSRDRLVAIATFAALLLYASIFFWTNWDPSFHIEQAYKRLLIHLAPASALVIATAWARIAGVEPPKYSEL